MAVNEEFDEGFKAGFKRCQEMALEAVAKVQTQSSYKPDDIYLPWVHEDRRASDVKNDCEEAIKKLASTKFK